MSKSAIARRRSGMVPTSPDAPLTRVPQVTNFSQPKRVEGPVVSGRAAAPKPFSGASWRAADLRALSTRPTSNESGPSLSRSAIWTMPAMHPSSMYTPWRTPLRGSGKDHPRCPSSRTAP